MNRGAVLLEAYQANKTLIIKLQGTQLFLGNYLANLEDEEGERTGEEVRIRKEKKNLWS